MMPLRSLSRPHRSGSPGAPAEDRCRRWYEEHGEAVYNYVRFQVASPDVAEDLVAETFLRAVVAGDRYDEARGPPRAWLLAIARNLVRDHHRRGRVRQYVPLGTMRDLVSDAPSVEERLLQEEEVGRILDALATLADDDREIVSLRYASELDGRDAAAMLGISEANVRTRLWRALKRLKAALGELDAGG
ncbi:MAG TPA: RNA polymerase sigma factor [Gemmatimonadales bacterium]|nr:RNA polymerase sigma factor [Gemmatimonadales bacterium]